LLSLVLLRTAWYRGGVGRRTASLAGTLAVHALLGFVPTHWLSWVPWGWPLVLLLFPLALLVGESWRWGVNSALWFTGFSLVFATCFYVGLTLPSSAGMAGDPRVFAIDQPLQLILHDVYLVSAFMTLLLLCWRLPVWLKHAFAYVGERSLFVFLAHSFVFQALRMAGVIDWLDQALPSPVLAVAISFLLTLALTLFGYWAVRAVPRLYNSVFPRSYTDWRLALSGARP